MGKITHYIIYGLHSGDGVIRYVGRSIHGKNRLSYHKADARGGKTNMPVHKWMRSVGIESVVLEVLEECESETDLPAREDYWITELKTHVTDGGLNVAIGANGGYSSVPISDETRIRMKESAKRRLESESSKTRQKRLETLKKNGEARPFLGHRHSEESLEKMRLSKKDKHRGTNNPNSKLTTDQIAYIKSYPGYYGATPYLAELFNVSTATIFRHRKKEIG